MTDQKMREHRLETLALHAGRDIDPHTTASEQAAETLANYVRLSVGLGSRDDILYDLDQALSGA
jgi:O-acetylhomoserine/O-acetylserine sulfhydrylase-like pyridoxal-dependent enzyme